MPHAVSAPLKTTLAKVLGSHPEMFTVAQVGVPRTSDDQWELLLNAAADLSGVLLKFPENPTPVESSAVTQAMFGMGASKPTVMVQVEGHSGSVAEFVFRLILLEGADLL